MAEIPAKIENIIRSYIKILTDNEFPLKRAFLFGSYAKGTAQEWSDIDLAIVSDFFEGNRMKDRSKIRRFTIRASHDLEVLPFSSDSFNEKEDPFVAEIIRTGIEIPI